MTATSVPGRPAEARPSVSQLWHGPYQSAFTHRDGEKVEIEKTELLDETITGDPGSVTQIQSSDAIILASNRGLLIKEIVINDEKIVPANIFVVGDILENKKQEDGSDE